MLSPVSLPLSTASSLFTMASLAAFKPVAIRSVRASRASAVVPVAAFPSKYVSQVRARARWGGDEMIFPLPLLAVELGRGASSSPFRALS